jgi:hypothetical protein
MVLPKDEDLFMIELLSKLPGNVIGFVASGQVTANDYETVLIPAVELGLKQYEKIRIFYHCDTTFSGFTSGAMWDDAKFGLGHLKGWEKIAIVTDKEWIKSASDILKFAIPCPLKVFTNNQYSEAQIWITA